MTPAHRKTCNILAIVFGVIYCIVIIIGFLWAFLFIPALLDIVDVA
jgi:heme/copper-type cytochrome/quinol oxidase subunit 4